LGGSSKGDLDLAIADYNEALKINPKYAKAYYNRGLAYKSQAEADYKKAVELNPEFAKYPYK
jgi:tetratricopeptide (TPR) repeat protein